jgi:DNA polymerase-3 subunit delta
MRISTEQLQPHLGRELRPLYTVYGAETLLAIEASDLIRARARAESYTEREVLTVESGFKWSQLALAAGTQSLFAARKLLELRIPTGKPGAEGGAAIQAYCGALPADTVTLVHLPALDWRTLKTGWFDALERTGVAVEARVVARRALPQWLAGRLKAQHQDADARTLEFIAERVEGNLMAAYQEVQKLALLHPAGTISFEQVRDAVLDVARYDVFSLGEALLEGDVARLARMLDGLRGEGVAPPLVLWAITEEIRAIGKILAGVAAGKPLAVLWREARVFGAPHQNLMQQNYQRFSLGQVSDALRHAGVIDRTIKGLSKGDAWDELLQLALRFARSAPARSAGSAVPARAARRPPAASQQNALF